jgi:hypothetical protein
MGVTGAHMLTLPCQTTVYVKTANDHSTDPLATEVRSAQATTYSNLLGGNTWVPYQSYIWQMNTNASGVPNVAFSDFVFPSNPATDPAFSNSFWQLTGTLQKYDVFSNILQSKKPLSCVQTIVYRNDCGKPIGSIANADFYESGVFTCDYSLDEAGSPFPYFDKANGWERDNSIPAILATDNTKIHFGQKVLNVTYGQGVMRNFKIHSGIKYVLSAWLNVTSASNFTISVKYLTGPTTVSTWPVSYTDLTPGSESLYNYSSTGQWQLAKIEIPAQTGDNKWIRITIGITNSSGSAYIDDIRFAPYNAVVTTTYYDQIWLQPILSVDANNNPDRLVKYDVFGRPVERCKIAKVLNRGCGMDTVMDRKAYHFINDIPFPNPSKIYKIISKLNPGAYEALQILNGDMTSGVQLTTYTYQLNTSWYNWKFVSVGDGYYNIVSQNNPNSSTYNLCAVASTSPNIPTVQVQIANSAASNQLWKVVDVGDGYYALECKDFNNFCLHANSATVNNGTTIDISKYMVGYNQQWQIIEVQ